MPEALPPSTPQHQVRIGDPPFPPPIKRKGYSSVFRPQNLSDAFDAADAADAAGTVPMDSDDDDVNEPFSEMDISRG